MIKTRNHGFESRLRLAHFEHRVNYQKLPIYQNGHHFGLVEPMTTKS